jgi:drug/metabolite transporter (DMT)-like permease
MWIILSLFAGLADALRDAYSKKASQSIAGPLITWSYSLFALPFALPGMLRNIPETIPTLFWILLLGMCCAHVVGGLLLVKALRLSDLSLCTPMVAFTPVFLLVIGPLITGDTPSLYGILGALLVACGSYVLNLGKAQRGLLAPFRALFEERGSRIMLALALLWSVTGSVDRLAVQRFNPSFWGAAQLCGIALLLLPVVLRQGALRGGVSKRSALLLLTLGGLNVLSVAGYLVALQTAPVHYVICLKRSSILFSVLLGRAVFGESLVADRLPGALLMLCGVVIISLFG